MGEENAFAVLARATDLANSGRDIINLGIGQPDFRTPEHIVDAAVKALRDGHHGYTPATGILPDVYIDDTPGYPNLSLTGEIDRESDAQLTEALVRLQHRGVMHSNAQ